MIYRMNRRGARHGAWDEECADAIFSAEEKGYIVCVLGDGVSSCEEGAKGAQIAVQAAGNMLIRKSEEFMRFSGDEICGYLFPHVRYELERSVTDDDEKAEQVQERASTLSAVVYDQRSRKLLCLNLGDSLIMTIKKEAYEIPVKPHLFADRTSVTTVTENGMQLAEATVVDASNVQSVLLCSDGAWRGMFDNHSMKPKVLKMLTDGDPTGLEDFLSAGDPDDDCSFLFFQTGNKEK